MGSLGRDALVAISAQRAGDPSLASILNQDLNMWLRDRAFDTMWPETVKRGVAIPLPQGQQVVTIGAAPGGSPNGGIGDQINRIYDPVWIYSSTYSRRGECRVRQIFGGTIDDDETINNPATNSGIPTRCKVRSHNYNPGQAQPLGAWDLVFLPIPDQAYLAAIDYQFIPNDLDTTVGGSDAATKPWYPNDNTMMLYLIAMAHLYKNRYDDYAQMLNLVGEKTSSDRMKLAQIPGTDDTNNLDEGMFRTSPPANYPNW